MPKKTNAKRTRPKARSNPEVAKLRQQIANMQVQKTPKTARVPTFGSALGDLGTIAGNQFSKIFGFGSYSLKSNSVFDAKTQSQVPSVHSSNESVTFRHREYICDVSSSAAFVQTTYAINPGLSLSFPYLSAVAQNFQEYQFKGLIYEFRSTSANALNSTNTALGTIMMAAQYRADSTPFTDKQQLLNEMWSIDGKPSESMILPIECSPVENPLRIQYVRGSAVPAGQDQKLYDLAKVTVASYGSQATAVVGELWVSYDVLLRKPQLSSALDLYGQTSHHSLTSADGTNTLGASRTSIFDGIGITFTSTDTIVFPLGAQGNFLIALNYRGTAQSAGGLPTFTKTNCSFPAFLYATSGNTSSGIAVPNGIVAATTDMSVSQIIIISDSAKQATFRISAGAFPTACTGDLIITQVPINVV